MLCFPFDPDFVLLLDRTEWAPTMTYRKGGVVMLKRMMISENLLFWRPPTLRKDDDEGIPRNERGSRQQKMRGDKGRYCPFGHTLYDLLLL